MKYGRGPSSFSRSINSTQGTGAIHASSHKSAGGKAAQSKTAPRKAYLKVEDLRKAKDIPVIIHEGHEGYEKNEQLMNESLPFQFAYTPEVNQQSNAFSASLEVVYNLRFFCSRKFIKGFDLHYFLSKTKKIGIVFLL
jgi:hypothetical protein